MSELVTQNWWLLVLALVLGLLVAWWIFVASRRTRVQIDRRDALDEGADKARRNQALIDAPAPAPSAPTPTPVAQPVAASAGGDDLTRIKGVGPKLAALLQSLGVTTFSDIAAWDDATIDRIDARLGQFSGRIRRDNWVEQARYLSAGDKAGFEEQFGKL